MRLLPLLAAALLLPAAASADATPIQVELIPPLGVGGDEVDGLSLGFFAVEADRVDGAQLAIGLAVSSGDVHGLQGAVGAALVSGELRGLQVASGLGQAGSVDGVQGSLVNVAGDVRGLQLGLVNVGGVVNGVQLGLVNVARDGEAPIGLVSVVAEGIHDVELFGTEAGFTVVGLQLGGRTLYTEFLAGARTLGWDRGGEVPLQWFALGFGGRKRLGERFYLDLDASGGNLFDGHLDHHPASLLGVVRASVGLELIAGIAVVAGPTLNGLVTLRGEEPDLAIGPQLHVVSREAQVRVWPGLRLGVTL